MTAEQVNDLVLGFRRVIVAAWPEVLAASRLNETGSFLQDWLQANWEAIVEAALGPGVFLEVYGDGADCNVESSRVYRPEATATHAIICLSRPGEGTVTDRLTGRLVALGPQGLPLEEFVSMEGPWFAREPPFDCVLVEQDGASYVFRNEDVIFSLGPASRG